jgi:hypothetical protein
VSDYGDESSPGVEKKVWEFYAKGVKKAHESNFLSTA